MLSVRRSPLSRPGLAFLIAVAVAAAGMFGAWWITPDALLPDGGTFASQIVAASPDQFRPEPREWSAYLALLLATPLAVALGLWLTRGMAVDARPRPADVLLLLAGLGLAAWATARDELSGLFNPGLPAMAGFGVLALVGAAAGAWGLVPSVRGVGKLHRLVLAGLCIMAVLISFATRVIGVESIGTLPFMPHFSAFLHSIVQISLGATCTVSVVPQYGCYGEFYAPLLKLTGVNVLNATLLTALLQAAALVSIMVFAARLVLSPLVLLTAGLWLILMQNWVLVGVMDPYFQYGPLRLLFPALSLAAALWFTARPGSARAAWLGAFGSLAWMFNPDSGSVVLLALALLAAATALACRGGRPLVRCGLFAAAFLGGALAAGGAFMLLLAWKGGALPQLLQLMAYPRIFAAEGFMMLPVQDLPALWAVVAALLLLGILLAALDLTQGWTREALLTLYVAILGAGVMSYHVGRSHPNTLLLCMWPAVVVAARLLDRLIGAPGEDASRSKAFIGRATAMLLLGLVSAIAIRGVPLMAGTAVARWQPVLAGNGTAEPAALRFIAQQSGGEAYEVIGIDQPVLAAEAGHRSAYGGPGVAETLLRKDAAAYVDYLLDTRPPHLFIDYRLVDNQPFWLNTAPWIRDALPRLRSIYSLKNWSADGEMMHLVRKPTAGPDLFDRQLTCAGPACPPPQTIVFAARDGRLWQRWDRPAQLPIDLQERVPAGGFDIIMTVTPAREQVTYATIVSNHVYAFEGFTLHYLPRSNGYYSLAVGDGTRWHASNPFIIPPGRRSRLVLRAEGDHFTVSLDGETVSELTVKNARVLGAPTVPVTFGDVALRGRAFAGSIDFAALVPHPEQQGGKP